MEPRFAALAADLSNELRQLNQLVLELAELRQRLPTPPTTVEIRAAGSILRDFYNGSKRLFVRIASAIDSSVPVGPNWHVELLSRVAYPIPDVRPAVISDTLRQRLGDYLRFRHLFRNVYSRELRWDLLRPLVDDPPTVHRELTGDVRVFAAFLQSLTA